MGIKFLCPNGHKLNVKSFLSGKKAICPKCGARVIVPQQDDPQTGGPQGDRELGAGFDRISAADEGWSDISTAEAEVLPAPSAAAGPIASAASSPLAGDAISDAPSAVWYVRPATGGQFGPASGEIMRAWLGEGRVGASSLVWRAGWTDWRTAAAVFPQLGGPMAPPGVAPIGAAVPQPLANGPMPPGGSSLPRGQVVQSVAAGPREAGTVAGPDAGGLSASVPPLAQVIRRRRRQNDMRLIASAVLTVSIILLAIALYFVWPSQNAPDPTPTQKSDEPAEDLMS